MTHRIASLPIRHPETRALRTAEEMAQLKGEPVVATDSGASKDKAGDKD